MTEVYSVRPELYDKLYGGEGDVSLDFMRWFFDYIELNKSTHKILDMGAGTGRLLIPLTQEGYQIEGHEPFQGMIEQALIKAGESNMEIQIHVGSYQTLSESEKYQLIFGINGTMAYLTKISELEDAFMRIHNALVPGGYFLVDIMNFYSLIKNYKYPEIEELQYGDWKGAALIKHEIDRDGDIWVHKLLLYIEEEGKLKRFEDVHHLGMINMRELKLYARNAGLEFKFNLQSHEDRPDDRKSGNRLIVIFRKPVKT